MLLGFGVAQRMYQDRYGDPGSPEEQHNASHQYVLQTSASGAVLFMVRRSSGDLARLLLLCFGHI